MAGTLRENKPELLSKRIRPVNSSEFLFRSLQILGVLHATERENVVVIGTLHRYRIKRKKKELVMNYNATKGRVDSLDNLRLATAAKD